MLVWFSNLVPTLFYILFFVAPLVLFPKTSEVFEFNKIVAVYAITTLIISSWITKMVLQKKIIFRRTILDIPLLIFLGIQILSTITSIDRHTSIFGYYGRFHGGLLSTITYLLLYWAYVTNLSKKQSYKTFIAMLTSGYVVSAYAFLQRMGIDKDLWNQDVQNRVFSTLGQPNWLAAWITAMIPLTWAIALESGIRNQELGIRNKKLLLSISLTILFFLTLLFTKSRSGLLGFAVAEAGFWSIVFSIKKRKNYPKVVLKIFLILNSAFIILVLIVGTPWTPTLGSLISKSAIVNSNLQTMTLEPGGTESGEIRMLVWKGAFQIFKSKPLLGTGPETFAYAYPQVRPIEHNLVSEWEYIYNKAHNEYLNFAATSGSVGMISYLALITVSLFVLLRQSGVLTNLANQSIKTPKDVRGHSQNIRDFRDINGKVIVLALLSGYVSILVTNFFGFSVVVVALQFFLFPAMAVSLKESGIRNQELRKVDLSISQKIEIVLTLILTSYFLILISRYWFADYSYSQGLLENSKGNLASALKWSQTAVNISPNEPVYYSALATITSNIAINLSEAGNNTDALDFVKQSINYSDKSLSSSPRNITLCKKRAGLLIDLSSFDAKYLIQARETLNRASAFAPTDAKLFYNLGLAYARTGEFEKAIETLEKTVALKPNYRDARFTLALLYIQKGELDRAVDELVYILAKINPQDSLVREQLEEIRHYE